MSVERRFVLFLKFCAGLFIIFLLVMLSPILFLVTGYHTGPRRNTPFPEAHQRAVTSFVASEGFGVHRLGRRHDFWQELSVNLEGTEYGTLNIHLIGLTPEKGDRYFERTDLPRKEAIATTEHRSATAEEAAAIAQLRAGSPWVRLSAPSYPEYDGERKQIRVIAPVFAQQSCLECHEVKTGALLGAFDYWLVDLSEKEEAQDPVSP